MYIAKVAVQGFSFFISFYGLAANCSWLCNGMSSPGASFNKEKIILAQSSWLDAWVNDRLLYKSFGYGYYTYIE